MELKERSKAAMGNVAAFVAKYPLVSLLGVVAIGATVIAAVSQPAGIVAAAKTGAAIAGGMALTGVVTAAYNELGGEINALLKSGMDRAASAVLKAGEVIKEARPDLQQARAAVG